MKKGFTLIELIASICILVMLSTIVITTSVKKINETKEKAYDQLISSIEFAAQQYAIDKTDELTDLKTNYNTYITLETLVNNDYLTNSLINPKTKQALLLSDEVYVTKSYNGNVVAQYDIDQSTKTKLKLVGSYNIYIKQNTVYTEPGILNENGENITNTLSIENNVNTSSVGNYVITYKDTTTNSSITRNVIVLQQDKSVTTITYLRDYILKLYDNESSRSINGLIKDNTTESNVRYSGSNAVVKNYVEFNNEIWRIVGVFKNTVKLVRNSSIGNYSWDSSSSSLNSGTGINQWGTATCSSSGDVCDSKTSYTGSDLMKELNDTYLNSTSGTCYNGTNNTTTTCNFSGTIKGLDSTSRSMIIQNEYKIGVSTWDSTTKPYTLSLLTEYSNENNNTSGTALSNLNRVYSWTGYVGLISPSDYGYATEDTSCRENLRSGIVYRNNTYNYQKASCRYNNWLDFGEDYWTITPYKDDSTSVFNVTKDGVIDTKNASSTLAIYPVVYLNVKVAIKSGIGTLANPYKLYMEA